MIFALSLTLMLAASYTDAEAQGLFSEANQAYAVGNHARAAELYAKLASSGFDSATVLYNAGTVELNEGSLGRAIWYLERARMKEGSSSDLERNLQVARSRQIDQIVGAGTDLSFSDRVAGKTDPRLSSIALVICLWAACLSALAALFRVAWRRTGSVLSAASILLALFFAALIYNHAFAQSGSRRAIVLQASLPSRALPGVDAPVLFEAHEGLKVKILVTRGKSTKIRLPNGLEGWVASEGIREL